MKRALLSLLAMTAFAQVTENRVTVDGKDYMVMRINLPREEARSRYGRATQPPQQIITVFKPHSDKGPQWRGNPEDVISRERCIAEECEKTDKDFVVQVLRKQK